MQGNTLSSCPQPMPLETQMTLALLQELLMAGGRCGPVVSSSCPQTSELPITTSFSVIDQLP